MNFKHDETLDEYIHRHKEVRNEMIAAQYLHIQHEKTTIEFIIEGPGDRPENAQHITLLTAQRFSTIAKFKSVLLSIVKKNLAAPPNAGTQTAYANLPRWCEFHNAPIHSIRDCRTLQDIERRRGAPPAFRYCDAYNIYTRRGQYENRYKIGVIRGRVRGNPNPRPSAHAAQ